MVIRKDKRRGEGRFETREAVLAVKSGFEVKVYQSRDDDGNWADPHMSIPSTDIDVDHKESIIELMAAMVMGSQIMEEWLAAWDD